jgi:hypothetical protein
VRAVVLLLSVLAVIGAPSPSRAQPAEPSRILDVPYLPQTEALCGGAAAAMVMRYWGERDIYADAFSKLVDRAAGGIRASALEASLKERKWIALAGSGDPARLAQQLERGRPVIALLEDRPRRFHYVVVVGWSGGRVVLHDPGRGPFRTVDQASFVRVWDRAERWMMIVLPPEVTTTTVPASSSEETSESGNDGTCGGLVGEGVRLARSGDRSASRRTLQSAAEACPEESAPWRELAGLEALEGNWAAAEMHARSAIDRDDDDEQAWRILGTAAYLRDRPREALDAWNHLGQPTVDLVQIKGLDRTRYAVIADAVNAPPGSLVTVDHLAVAERRTREIPSLAAGRVAYHPLENGRAQINVTVVEKRLAPTAPSAWVGLGLEALTDHEVSPSLAGMTGGGELITASWRWWAHRPRVGLSVAAPAPRALGGGVWRVDAFRETETFGEQRFEEVRTSVGLTVSNWITARTRLEGGASLDRWRGLDSMAGLSAAAEVWPIRDRLAIEGRVGTWLGNPTSFGSGSIQVEWRSSATMLGPVWHATSGIQAASGDAPASLWPGADTGHARDVLLRAHPLLDDGIITGGVFGRRVIYSSAEWRQWVRLSRWPVRVAPAAFVDIARASQGLPSTDLRTHTDVGVGARLALPGTSVLRIDLAKGLRDGHTALTIGWTR